MKDILYIYGKEKHLPSDNSLQKVRDRLSVPFLHVDQVQTLHQSSDDALIGFGDGSNNCLKSKDQAEYIFNEATFHINGAKTKIKLNTSQLRSFWYINTSNYFAVSTSQRILIMILKDYQPDPGTKAWMLSAGTLGPTNSWDKRISRVNPWYVLHFDKESENVRETPRLYNDNLDMTNNYLSSLDNALEVSLSTLDLENKKWLLTLSGGVDSRALFHKLRQENNLECITWGFKTDLGESHNDLDISKKLTTKYGIEHDIRLINGSAHNAEEILKRFLFFSEGTVDHLAGYIDGFELWHDLKEEEVDFVLRGDNLFFKQISRPPMLSDYSGLSIPWERNQRWPAQFERRENESVDRWQLRMYRDYRIPIVMSSLNSLKMPFTGVVNPYLSRSMMEFTSSLPPSMVVGKDILKEYIRSFDDKIPYANCSTNQSLSHILSQTDFQQVMLDSIQSPSSGVSTAFSSSLVSKIENTETSSNSAEFTDRVKSIAATYLPETVVRWIVKNKKRYTLPSNERLLFRLFIIEEMDQILQEDSSKLK